MINRKYKLKESVDVYIFGESDDSVNIQFYKINTREKTTIEINRAFSDVLSAMDGKERLNDIMASRGIEYERKELEGLISYLSSKGIVREVLDQESINKFEEERYSRQINYFDDLLPLRRGEDSQKELMSKKVTIIGCGATGGLIASLLVRAGIKKINLVDYKKIHKSNFVRHIYYSPDNEGEHKALALKEYLSDIDSQVDVECFFEKIRPNTELGGIILGDENVVVNTADEPYIGHISVKLGRYLWDKNIALYVSGGFDAHLMSSGELIFRGETPCIDCCANTFKKALKNWKPNYNNISDSLFIDNENELSPIIGGAGGLFPQALYSASLATINIVDHLLGNNKGNKKLNMRGEFLVDLCEHTWFEMKKQKGCYFCG